MGPLRGGGGMPTRGRGGFGSPPGRGGYPVPTRGGYGSPPSSRGGYGSPSPSRGGYGSPPPTRGGYGPTGRGGVVGLPGRVSPHEGGPGPPRAAIGARGGRGGAQGFGTAARPYDASPVYGQGPVRSRSNSPERMRYGSPPRADSPPSRGRVASMESTYSQDDGFMPARTGWNDGPATREPDDFDVYSLYENGPYDDGEPMPRTRSPAESDRSGFTSISQRSVNPRWRGKAQPPRRPSNASLVPRGLVPQKPLRRPDVLLDNPDFSLGGGGGGARRGGMGLTPGSAYPTTAY